MSVLDGFQVVEVNAGIGASVAGMLLADYGAQVVKVEPPEGDVARRLPGSPAWNRGKHSVVCGHQDPDVEALVAGADVVILSGSGPDERFGLDAGQLRSRHPRLIVAEAPPYTGPAPWLGGHESASLLAADLGIARRQSSFDGGPVESVTPVLAYLHGGWLATCIVAALVERERSGFGHGIEVSAAQASLLASGGIVSIDPDVPDPSSAVGPAGRHPTYTRYRCRDDRWIVTGALGAKFERALLRELGLEAVLEAPRLGGDTANLIKPENLSWAADQVAAAFLRRDRDDWLAAFLSLGIPCGAVSDRDDWLDDPQVKAIGARLEGRTADGRPSVVPGSPVVLTQTPARVEANEPACGADDVTTLVRPPASAPAGRAPVRRGPLAGVCVLNIGTFVATPFAGSLLADLGADVIKVEPVAGDPFRTSGFIYNRGMRSLALDLRSATGLETFMRLVERTDLVINGQRPGVAEKLGIDHDETSRRKPDIITTSLSAYGEAGELAHLPGVDMALQGQSGMMSAQGGDDEPVANTMPIIDTATSVMLVYASLLSLCHRLRTGEGQRAWASLAGTSVFLQLGELARYENRPPAPRGGRDYLGPSALDRFYRTADGWLRVQAAHTVGSSALVDAAMVDAGLVADGSPGGSLTESLVTSLAGTDTATAVARFAAAGIPAVPARLIGDAVRDPQLLRHDHVHVRQGDGGGTFLTIGRIATFDRAPRSGPMTSPGIGEHTTDVLTAVGISESDVADLAGSGVVAVGGPMAQRLPPVYR